MLAGIQFMQQTQGVKDIPLKDKRVLIRVDFNVPMDKDLNITDDTRIRESLPTINHCIDAGVSCITLVSHLGRPKSKDFNLSLKHVLKRLERLLGRDILFAESIERARELQKNQSPIILLENTRFFDGETSNDELLSRNLASLCDIFINDAFGTSHRKHASTYGMANFVQQKVAGILLKKETQFFAKALDNPIRPMLLIIGGSKVSSKLELLYNIIQIVDKLIIGGAMSNTFLKALGFDTQKSQVEEELIQDAKNILEIAKKNGTKVYLPVDVVCTNSIEQMQDVKITPVQDIYPGYVIADIGPATTKLFSQVIHGSNTIIWNGPLGVYEQPQFSRGTFSVAHAISETYAFSLIGGGDTADAVSRAGQKDNMSFISTGGGASLELLEGKVLSAFEVLDKKE